MRSRARGGSPRLAGGPLFWQRPVEDLSPDPEVPLERVEVRVLSGSAIAHAAVVDNVTGDGVRPLGRAHDAAMKASLAAAALREAAAYSAASRGVSLVGMVDGKVVLEDDPSGGATRGRPRTRSGSSRA